MLPPDLTDECALFLDFDGTLVEIAPTPDQVVVDPALPGLLAQIENRLAGALAVVSGRTVDNLRARLAPYEGTLAGSHGLERLMPDGSLVNADARHEPVAAEIAQQIQSFVAKNTGTICEAKRFSVSLHYRSRPELRDECERIVRAIAPAGWAILDGKGVFELRPASVSKGTALQAILQSEPFAGRMPVFIGDDTTDEDGMAAAAELGGFGIKVGSGASQARFRLETVADVHAYLERLAG